LPLEFYRRLPSVTSAVEEGLPRAFSLAHGLLNASRLQLSLPGAVQFLRAYQENAPLTIAELWAFPTMLRLACLEILVDAFGRLFPALTPPFEPTKYTTLLGSFEDTERVSRALANLGVIAAIPWKDFFDRTSRVEALLQGDPAGVYPRTDFDTRDRCRKAVEELAYGSCQSEPEVVEFVLAQAGDARATRPRDHVGYWLIGDGRRDIEAVIGYRQSSVAACRRWLFRNAGPFYAAALLITGIAALVLPAFYLAAEGAGPLAWAVGIALALLPASVLGVTLVHWIVTLVVSPWVLPKLDFEEGIPPDCSTAVVMPVIVGSPAEVPGLIERMEMHRLSNPDPSLRFALLSDHIDAPAEHMPGDTEVEKTLVSGIRRLNARYGQSGDGPFHLLHRPRRFNPAEDCWMAWERKRGKLEQFNRFVLGEETSGLSVTEGNMDALRGIRFVVTVDADTTLPPGSVSRLVGTLAHPLNSACLDEGSGRFRAGYTVVQPRVEISPESGNRSLFARLYAGDTAVDIYSRAVS
ncbi:MAG TPA: cellobiose phosphorylase, partial [Candidatus Binatia bacterium]